MRSACTLVSIASLLLVACGGAPPSISSPPPPGPKVEVPTQIVGPSAEGSAKELMEKGERAIEWTCGNAESLPFPDSHFDAYTIAFGIRNVTHIDQALREARRVLKPGGRFLCLHSRPSGD